MDHIRRQRQVSELAEEPAGAAARVSSMVATRETVRQVLAPLPEVYRQIVVLRDVDRLTYEEIAARLDRNVYTVKSQVSRGRALLASRLGEASDEPW